MDGNNGYSAQLRGCSMIGVALVALSAFPSHAAPIAWGGSGNDCAGFFSDPFGNGFDACQVWGPDTEGNKIAISPVIAKFETDSINKFYENYQTTTGDELEINNSLFPTVDGTEWTLEATSEESKAGTWVYNPQLPTEQTVGDPGIRYWATKAGNGFTLYWDVPDAALDSGGSCSTNVFSFTCLNEALAVTSGEWSIDKGLSHIAFYDSINPTLEPSLPTPVPAPLALLGLGGLMLGWITRKSRA